MENDRGNLQWDYFSSILRRTQPDCLAGPILDLGSGRGDLLCAGLAQGFDLWGIDTEQHRLKRFKQQLDARNLPSNWIDRCVVYDGLIMPFDAGHFQALVSWYVLEHVDTIETVMREAARVIGPGGMMVFRAQDARRSFDGHCNIPWPPFLPHALYRPWLEVFGKLDRLDYMLNHVFDFTMQQAAAVLEACGCEIVDISPAPDISIACHWLVRTEADTRELARTVKRLWDRGNYPKPLEPHLIARKK